MKNTSLKKPAAQVFQYHEQTKHNYNNYAKSPGYLDWKNQPAPFRFYSDTTLVKLPFLKQDPEISLSALFARENKVVEEFNLKNISTMMELSLGLSAWKQIGATKWSLRINPSSGNLHPTESYLILPEFDSLSGGIYHYNPLLHALELRAEIPDAVLEAWNKDSGSQGFFTALTSIFWRESWKYGERAFRYCNIDVGHALAALSFAAGIMGWRLDYVHGLKDEDLEQILGFDKTRWIQGEAEEVDLLCRIYPDKQKTRINRLSSSIIEEFKKCRFQGKPERLSKSQHPWPVIDNTAEACCKTDTDIEHTSFPDTMPLEMPKSMLSAAQIIRQRRSAVDFRRFDSRISREKFFGCLSACIPRNNCSPFDVKLIRPSVHLFIFVHNITGLKKGLYVFVRNPEDFEHLKSHTHPHFLWENIEPGFPLYLLSAGDWREKAKNVSCNQDIAGSSAFSLGMAARFKELIEDKPWKYKALHWETGMIGQVLYLQAEAYQLRGTGIGCFFDDPMHDICGFKDNTYQILYHFTVGAPIEDTRLSTLEPYHHLNTSSKTS